MATVTKRKLTDGSYRVIVDGRDTQLRIAKGHSPRYREPQFWCIGHQRSADDTDVDWLAGDLTGLESALSMIRIIVSQSQPQQ